MHRFFQSAENFSIAAKGVSIVIEISVPFFFDVYGVEIRCSCRNRFFPRHIGCRIHQISHDVPLKSPFAAQDAINQSFMRTDIGCADAVKRSHRPQHSVFKGNLEAAQFQFACLLLRHEGRHAIAVCFLIIECKVFAGCNQALAVRTLRIRRGKETGQHRIFRIVFHVSTAVGCAMQVQSRPPDNRQPVEKAVIAEQCPDCLRKLLVKRRAHQLRRAHVMHLVTRIGVFRRNVPRRIGVRYVGNTAEEAHWAVIGKRSA